MKFDSRNSSVPYIDQVATVFALIFALAVAVTLFGLTVAARALFRRGDNAHQVVAPSGVWHTKVLWTGRGVAVGPVAQTVKRLTGASPDKDKRRARSESGRTSCWALMNPSSGWLAQRPR